MNIVTCNNTSVCYCGYDEYAKNLTLGKSYRVMSETKTGYLITDDAGDIYEYPREHFSQ